MDLGANDEQCEFPIIYASGVKGVAGYSPDDVAEDLQPLFEMIVKEVGPLVGPLGQQPCRAAPRERLLRLRRI